MPWQRDVVDVGLEVDPATGRVAYRELIVTVMRQNGKTVLVLSVEVDRCVSPSWGGPQRVVYSAQTGWDARRKLLEDHVPMLEMSPLSGALGRVLRGAGNEAVVWSNHSRIELMPSGPAAGHGRTNDLAVADEAFDDEDDRREQALLPSMVTRPDAQLMVVSTAGDDRSLWLRSKVEAGRAAAARNVGRGICYVEYSIPDGDDVDDPEVWWAHMPALGWTIGEDVVAHARQTMSDQAFRRSFGNQWVSAGERVIPAEFWGRVCSDDAAPSGRLTFGVDVSADRTKAAIAACGGGTVELLEYGDGVGWVVDRCRQLHERWGGRFVFDGSGPGDGAAVELRALLGGRTVESFTPRQVAVACGRFYDAVVDATLQVRRSAALDVAVDGLAKRTVGDRWLWSRSASTGDVSPLIAATLAHVAETVSVSLHI